MTSAAEGLRSTRVGVGRAASDVVRAAQTAASAYQQTVSRSAAPAPRYTPPALAAGNVAGAQGPDLTTAAVNLTRAEFAYKATAAAFRAQAEVTETLLDTLV
ncbi:hypothetical protein [Pyruvatibacter sp.]|uniref:hypothetical protein n=1 Tax=Pyruvatibacter sp. TaxID=1981328 RepID=UPI0032EBC857